MILSLSGSLCFPGRGGLVCGHSLAARPPLSRFAPLSTRRAYAPRFEQEDRPHRLYRCGGRQHDGERHRAAALGPGHYRLHLPVQLGHLPGGRHGAGLRVRPPRHQEPAGGRPHRLRRRDLPGVRLPDRRALLPRELDRQPGHRHHRRLLPLGLLPHPQRPHSGGPGHHSGGLDLHLRQPAGRQLGEPALYSGTGADPAAGRGYCRDGVGPF